MNQDAHGVSAKQRDELLLMHQIVIFSAFVDRSGRSLRGARQSRPEEFSN